MDDVASWISAFASIVSAGAVTVAAVVAVRTLRAHRADSEAMSRPMMAATLEADPLLSDYMHFVVANYGRGVAHDVRVCFDPDPMVDDNDERAADEHSRDFAMVVQSRYEEPLPAWVPGQVYRNIYMEWREGRNDLPLPDAFVVTIAYSSDTGRHYEDRFPLTVGSLQGQTVASPSTPTEAGQRKRAVDALESIARGVGRL